MTEPENKFILLSQLGNNLILILFMLFNGFQVGQAFYNDHAL